MGVFKEEGIITKLIALHDANRGDKLTLGMLWCDVVWCGVVYYHFRHFLINIDQVVHTQIEGNHDEMKMHVHSCHYSLSL